MATSLANKYRPQTFSEMVSQSTTVDMVKKLCSAETLSNRNFLFTGPAGCGKTSISRLIAKTLNGNMENIIEVDAASHGNVDDVRELIQEAAQYPIGSKYKVIIMDECFSSNTWISTPSGKIQIKDIHPGDRVYNFSGQATVSHVFANRVATDNLVSIIVGGRQIFTTKNHLFFTDDGWVPAYQLRSGDQLYDYSLLQTVRKTISSESSQQQEDTMQYGVSQDLVTQQDVRETYKRISENVSHMWQSLLHSNEYKCNNLFRELWIYLEKIESEYGTIVGATFKTLAYIYLSSMWEADGGAQQPKSQVLQQSVCNNLEQATSSPEKSCNQGMRMVQEFIYSSLQLSETKDMFSELSSSSNLQYRTREKESQVFYQDEDEQPYALSRSGDQDDGNQREKWHITSTACLAWWQRAIYCTSNALTENLGVWLDIGVRSENPSRSKQQSEALSYMLQTRPCLSGETLGHRGGWCFPSWEIPTVARREKGDISTTTRVDSIEIYQRGYNDELFRSGFTDTELSQDYVTMYDLEIDGHPSYFANDILVHNCHALSNTAWQTLLKCLEEQFGNTVWIFATTNPEKIPDTIITRVQTFKLAKIDAKTIQTRLKYILDSEIAEGREITYTDEALSYLAKYANGGMRDAITSLDKCLAFDTNITSEVLEKALDLPNYDEYFNLLNSLVRKDNTGIASMVDTVYNSGTNFVKWFEGFHSFLCNIVKYVLLQDISKTMIPYHYQEKLSKYGSSHVFVCLKLANVVMAMNKELKFTQYLQETAITYLCTPIAPKKEG